jgi:hypothetical protein
VRPKPFEETYLYWQAVFGFFFDHPRCAGVVDQQTAALKCVNEEQTASLKTALLHVVRDLSSGPGCEPLSGAPFTSRGAHAGEPAKG